MRFPLCTAGVLVIGGIVWWMMTRQDATPPSDNAVERCSSQIKEVKPAKAKSQVSQAEKMATPTTDKNRIDEPDTNIVWVSKRSYIQKLSNGKSVTIYVDDPNEMKEKPMFEVGLNNFLANFITPGENVPETPMRVSDDEVVAAFMEKIEIKDDDTDDVRYQKEAVLLLRKDLQSYIKDGRTVADFIRDVQQRQQQEANYVREARGMIMESLANEEPTHARELYDALNKHMNEKGLPKIRLPKRYLKLMEESK